MEPRSSEQLPTPIETGEYAVSPERTPAATPENRELTVERKIEQRTAQPSTGSIQAPVQLPAPIAPLPVVKNDDATLDDSQAPLVAADEDLIEKEWVDRAKKVIAETRDDPYKRERAVGKLQADYLKKRYGKELGNQP